jgi:hypothetical protein
MVTSLSLGGRIAVTLHKHTTIMIVWSRPKFK